MLRRFRCVENFQIFHSKGVCVCVFSSHSFWTSSSLDVPAGVTQEEGHTGFLIHLLSAVRAFIFLARRIQPFLSLVDREVEFCVVVFTLTDRASTIPSNIRGCQSGTWSQRGTKVNGSHHGDNPLLRPTGIQIATKSYATLQAMAPTNNKTVHQTSFTPYYREQPRSTRIVFAYPRPAFSATNRTNTFQPVLINNSKFIKATHRTKIRKIEIPRSMVVEALSC